MPTAKNDITGDRIMTKRTNDKYAKGWDRIFGKRKDRSSSGVKPVVSETRKKTV